MHVYRMRTECTGTWYITWWMKIIGYIQELNLAPILFHLSMEMVDFFSSSILNDSLVIELIFIIS